MTSSSEGTPLAADNMPIVSRADIRVQYAARPLTTGYPDLENLAIQYRSGTDHREGTDSQDVEKTVRYLSRLIDLRGPRNIAVIGCGHRPKMIRALLDMGHNAIGIEPVAAYVRAASEYLGKDDIVLRGTAEDIRLPDDSQDVVLFENVLEHVDSVSRSLREIYRVTAPGGIAYVKTNSRLIISPRGRFGEFRVHYYNWLPQLVKEAYVHHHLHFDPSLANYTTRPAVHWFDYGELCQAGREAGFARFYSVIDVLESSDPSIARSRFRRALIDLVKYHPWVRALALTQVGGYIYMWKRPKDD